MVLEATGVKVRMSIWFTKAFFLLISSHDKEISHFPIFYKDVPHIFYLYHITSPDINSLPQIPSTDIVMLETIASNSEQ